MFFFSYTAAILSLISFGFAAFIYYEKRRDFLAQYLAYHVFAVGVWIGSNAIADVARTHSGLVFWSGVAIIGVSFFASFYLCFIYAFMNGRPPGRTLRAIYFLPALIFSLGAFSRFSVVETHFPTDAPTQIVPGILYPLLFIFVLGSLLYGSIKFARFRKHRATPQQKMQVVYMEIGFISLFVGSIIFGYVLPAFGELRFFNVGPQFAIILVFASSYAILKHQLLDIKVVIQKGITYSFLLILGTLFYVTALHAMLLFTDILSITSYLTASLITTFVGIISIPPLKRLFQKVTGHIFFRDSMSRTEALDELSRVLNHHIDLDELLGETEKTLVNVLRLRSAHIMLLGNGEVNLKASSAEHVRISELESKIPDDLRMPLFAAHQYQDLVATLEKGEWLKGAELVVPVTLKDEIIAFLALGGKKNDEPYYEHDVTFLKTFAYQCAVAIEKAKLHEQVKKYTEELEEKVEERTAEVRDLQEARGQMLIDISHNLQTPLTIIKGQLMNLREKNDRDAELKMFEASIDKVSDFIQRLMKLANLTKVEEVAKKDTDFSKLVEGILSYFQVMAEQEGISLKTDILNNLHVQGDKNQLEELVLNLLSNAVKYIDHEKVISVRLTQYDGFAKLVIQDTGVGIPEGELKNLFRRFYRYRQDHKVPGAGLGLAICKRIVDLHNGKILIESKVGEGTTVTVTLPKT